jgi:hypothetical protein
MSFRSTTRGITSQKMLLVFIGFLVLSSLFVAVKAESDEEGDILEDLFFFVAGAATEIAIHMCTQDTACGNMLFTITVAFIFMGIIIWCCTGECMCDCDRRSSRRAGAFLAGAGTGRFLRS